jgi:hypothetical protein
VVSPHYEGFSFTHDRGNEMNFAGPFMRHHETDSSIDFEILRSQPNAIFADKEWRNVRPFNVPPGFSKVQVEDTYPSRFCRQQFLLNGSGNHNDERRYEQCAWALILLQNTKRSATIRQARTRGMSLLLNLRLLGLVSSNRIDHENDPC